MIDIGNLHVIDWYLWQACRTLSHIKRGRCVHRAIDYGFDYRQSPEDWSRYDGELL